MATMKPVYDTASVPMDSFAYRSEELPPQDAQAEHYIRKPLLDFAYAMEDKLRKNDSKKGWRNLPVEALFRLLMLEIEEFKVSHEFFGKTEAQKELVDVANYCMILHDRLGMEGDKNSGVTK